MPATLPYLLSPGTLETAFKRMKEAATPTRFTTDFVSTVLQMKGGNGNAIPPFLKKVGLLNADATPTGLYDRFRNPGSSRNAIAEATRIGYKPLYLVNENAHRLNDTDLEGLVLQVTGLEKGNRVAQAVCGTFKKLCSYATFDEDLAVDRAAPDVVAPVSVGALVKQDALPSSGGVNLSYTINLNLPPTTNIEVFNAIFKSLREHLVSD